MVSMSMVVALLGCVTGEPRDRVVGENCVNGIDDNNNGLIDCEDVDECSANLACREGLGPDTGNSDEPVEIVIDQRRCCDFTFNAKSCRNLTAGTFDIVNRTDNDGIITAVRCDAIDDVGIPVGFRVDPLDPPDEFLNDVQVPAQSTVTVEAVFDCQAKEPFSATCEAKVEVGTLGDERGFLVRGTLE